LKLRAGIYLGYVGFQNLGDEAMWEVCRNRMRRIHWSTWDQVESGLSAGKFMHKVRADRQHLVHTLADELRGLRRTRLLGRKLAQRTAAGMGLGVGLLGGGTLINISDSYLQGYRHLFRRTGRPVPVFGTGVASPEFCSLQSGWTDRRKEWVELFRRLPVVGVRGPLSKALLEESGAHNVVVVGDPAVCFHRRLESADSPAPGPGRTRVAINCGAIGANPWASTERMESLLAGVSRELHARGHELVLFAVCPQDLPACHRVAAAVGSAQVAPLLASPQAFLKEASSWSVVVALKLHAGVLSAAANVPFVALEYRPKCMDFAASIGWEPFVLRINEASVEWIVSKVSVLLEEHPRLARDLCNRMCALCRTFEDYCRTLEPLLMGESMPIT